MADHWARRRGRRAFTLIELLIVVSVIAIVIGILLPALGSARRSARLAIDLANLKQHGIATMAFAQDQKGRMPAPPPGTGVTFANNNSGESVNLGTHDRPATRFAYKEFNEGPINFAWGIDYAGAWKGYQFFMGHYVVEGAKGFEILNDVFVSPGAKEIIQRWNLIRSRRFGEGNLTPVDFISRDRNLLADQRKPWINELDMVRGMPSVGMLQGSYRYTLAALVGSEEGNEDRHFFGPVVNQGFGTGSGQDPFAGNPPENWVAFRAYNLVDRFQHPSKKVTFWEYFAANNRDKERYWENGADTPLVLVDGSGRLSKPASDMPSCDNGEKNQFGTYTVFPDCLEGAAGGEPPRGSVHGRESWFLYTNGGVRGRDF